MGESKPRPSLCERERHQGKDHLVLTFSVTVAASRSNLPQSLINPFKTSIVTILQTKRWPCSAANKTRVLTVFHRGSLVLSYLHSGMPTTDAYRNDGVFVTSTSEQQWVGKIAQQRLPKIPGYPGINILAKNPVPTSEGCFTVHCESGATCNGRLCFCR